MTTTWKTTPATDVRPGDRVRFASGEELIVSRVEEAFFGRPEMRAFIEDTDVRWYKKPVPASSEVEVWLGDS